nr:restriction endonuclease subunit S [Olegusella massiliensis]
MKLREVCEIKYGKDHKKLTDGNVPVYGSGGIMRHVERPLFDQPSVLIPRKGTLANLFFTDSPFWTVDTLFWTKIDSEKIIPKFLYYVLKTKDLASLNVGTAVPSLTTEVLYEVELPDASVKQQTKIVSLLDCLDKKIELNKQLNDYLAA